MRKTKNVIFELSRPGRVGYSLPKSDVPKTDFKAKLARAPCPQTAGRTA